jgi:hypothetical protein
MKREFLKKEDGSRIVKACVWKNHTYHPECAPIAATEIWATTKHSCCAKCHKSLYKK